MTPMRTCLAAAVLALFGPLPAWADDAPVKLAYSAYADGLNVMDMQASLAMSPQSYRLQVSYHLTGMVGLLVHADATTTVDGRFHGEAAEPRELFSSGHMHGESRVTQIDWQNGKPVLSQLVPPVDEERDPVPVEQQLHTIDSLSAMAGLLRRLSDTGKCEGVATTFDGRRLSQIDVRTIGEEVLKPTGRSSFQGAALRCDFEGRQLAGFIHDADEAVLRRPQRGSAWFARLAPGSPLVPVRITFETRQFGAATMYLTGPPS